MHCCSSDLVVSKASSPNHILLLFKNNLSLKEQVLIPCIGDSHHTTIHKCLGRNPSKGLFYICVLNKAWLQTIPTTHDGSVGLCGRVTLGAAE